MKPRAAWNQIALHFVLLSVCQAPAGVNTKANPKLSVTHTKSIPRLSARLTRSISARRPRGCCGWWRACSLSLDHGRRRRQWPGPRLGHPPSLLWGHQVGCAGVRRSVYQNIPEQNFPRVPGQEETQEEWQESVRGQRVAVVMAEAAVSVWKKFSIFAGLQSAQKPAVILLIISEHGVLWSVSRVDLHGCIVLVNGVWQL